jgi:peroxiredoxin
MRVSLFNVAAILCCASFSGLCQEDQHVTLAIGAAAPAFSLPGVDGKTHKLAEYDESPILAIVFTCNHCPTAQLYEDRIKRIAADYRDKGVALVAIQPNDPNALRIDEMEMSDMSDSLEEMKLRASYRHFNYPYLYDGATQAVAEAYGPKATPHIFLFDRQRKLRYEGRIDDNQREGVVKINDARKALDAMVDGREVAVPHTGVFGCSTKWKYKAGSRLEAQRKIEAEPVTVELVDADGLKKLRANPTGKFLLISFWATWCVPCVAEFPDLQTTFRMYSTRPFQLVTVSANGPDERPSVTALLERQHATSRNLLFASTDTYALQAAFDAKWESALPFTILLAPDGKVLYRREGEIDILTLRRAILANIPTDYPGFREYWVTH